MLRPYLSLAPLLFFLGVLGVLAVKIKSRSLRITNISILMQGSLIKI